MARPSPAPCLALSVTISRRETSFSRSCAGRIPSFRSADSSTSLVIGEISSSAFLLLCGAGAGAADAGAVAASAVVAPALRPGLRRIVENPTAIGISADFVAFHLVVRQHLSKRCGNPCDHPSPVAPHRNHLGAEPILVLY